MKEIIIQNVSANNYMKANIKRTYKKKWNFRLNENVILFRIKLKLLKILSFYKYGFLCILFLFCYGMQNIDANTIKTPKDNQAYV